MGGGTTYTDALARAAVLTGGIDGQVVQRSGTAQFKAGPYALPADASGDLPTPTVAMIDNAIGIKSDGLYHVESLTHHSTPPSGAWGQVGGDLVNVSTIKPFFAGAYP